MTMKQQMFTFKKTYFFSTIFLFIIELLIAVFVNDRFIRPFVGDFLVVILIYCFIQTFTNFKIIATAIGVLLFAYIVEIGQYFEMVKLLGLAHNQLAVIILGNHFSWGDMLVYTLGILLVIWVEKWRKTGK
jgi:Protein of unknown function (DUF2809)